MKKKKEPLSHGPLRLQYTWPGYKYIRHLSYFNSQKDAQAALIDWQIHYPQMDLEIVSTEQDTKRYYQFQNI